MKRTVFASYHGNARLIDRQYTAQAAHTHEYTKQNSKVYVCECGKEKPTVFLKGTKEL